MSEQKGRAKPPKPPAAEVFTCQAWEGPLVLRVGDEVGTTNGSTYNPYYSIQRVARITHNGRRVRLDDGQEFNDGAVKVGSTSYYRPRLMSVDKARQLMDPRQSCDAMKILLERIADTATEMKRHSAPLAAEEKAKLLALVEQL